MSGLQYLITGVGVVCFLAGYIVFDSRDYFDYETRWNFPVIEFCFVLPTLLFIIHQLLY